MSPSTEVFSRFREPSNFDSDFASENVRDHTHDLHRFPAKYDHGEDPRYTLSSGGGLSRSGTHPHHYADSDFQSRSRLTSRTRTTSSARRSRKNSASTTRDLVRALVHEKLEADESTELQLARAVDIIREESRRAAQAERTALETAERLKSLAISRASAHKDAARAQAELKAYKLQLENAQRQVEEANAVAAASDMERIRAEQATRKLKHAVEKLRLSEAVKRAREEGRKEGLHESRYGLLRPSRSSPRVTVPFVDDEDDDILPRTPRSNVPLPVPPPNYSPSMSRRAPTPTIRRTQTPISALRGSQGSRTPVPEVLRQNFTPPSRRSQTPSHPLPVPPPSSFPVLSRRAGTPGAQHRPVNEEFVPVPPAEHLNIEPIPEHIFIRSPVPLRASSSTSPGPPVTQPFIQPRPPSSQASHPRSGHGSQSFHRPRPHSATHFSFDDPAARAAASADHIYSNYSSSTESSDTEPPRHPPPRILRRRDDLPQQETIVPRPAPGLRFSPPVRPPSAADSIPASAAAFARTRVRDSQRPRPVSVSSSSTSSPRAFPTPSSVSRVQRLPLGDRKWSAGSASSVPGIIIEPPSRPESVDSLATGVTLPSHMSPFVGSDGIVPDNSGAQASGWSGMPQSQQQPHPRGPMQPQRPPSRTGFSYGPLSPTTGRIPGRGGPGTPGPGIAGFTSPPSPGVAPSVHFGGTSAPQPVIPPARPGSAADYFTGDHRHNRHSTVGHGHPHGHEHAHGHMHGHRREPAGVSVENLGMPGLVDPNVFNNQATTANPPFDSDDEGEFRVATPRASAFSIPARDSSSGMPGTTLQDPYQSSSTSMEGFIPPRPPSSAAAAPEAHTFSPRYVPAPASASASASGYHDASRAGSVTSGKARGRNRRMSGGGPNGHPTSRTALGNTPFVRSSGLYDD